jgi:Cu+-exporting ATPase
MKQITLSLDGMSCASCVLRAERVLKGVAGVSSARVNLATRAADVQFEAPAKIDAMIVALTRAGYPASVDKSAPEPAISPRAVAAAALTAPVFLLEMGGHIVPAFHHLRMGLIGDQTWAFVQLILITIVLFGPGWMLSLIHISEPTRLM